MHSKQSDPLRNENLILHVLPLNTKLTQNIDQKYKLRHKYKLPDMSE